MCTFRKTACQWEENHTLKKPSSWVDWFLFLSLHPNCYLKHYPPHTVIHVSFWSQPSGSWDTGGRHVYIPQFYSMTEESYVIGKWGKYKSSLGRTNLLGSVLIEKLTRFCGPSFFWIIAYSHLELAGGQNSAGEISIGLLILLPGTEHLSLMQANLAFSTSNKHLLGTYYMQDATK